MMLFVRDDLKELFGQERRVEDFLRIEGEVFKAFPSRRTARFERGGRRFFIKCHWGVGWREIFKNLLAVRLPVVSSRNEWRAIRALETIGVDTMKLAAYGVEGLNPARRRSFVMTEALVGTDSLDRWAKRLVEQPPTAERIQRKRATIRKVAEIARALHENGINHRDFYLCHFLVDLGVSESATRPEELRFHVIDLHRVQIRRRTPERWVVKDVAGLFSSSMNLGLTSRDRLRFMQSYRGRPLREILCGEGGFWKKVTWRAVRTYRADSGRDPVVSGLDAG